MSDDAPPTFDPPILRRPGARPEVVYLITARWELWDCLDELQQATRDGAQLPEIAMLLQRWALPLLALRQIALLTAMAIFPGWLASLGGNMRSFMFLRPRIPGPAPSRRVDQDNWEFYIPAPVHGQPPAQVQSRHELHRQADHWRRNTTPFPHDDMLWRYAIPEFPAPSFTTPQWESIANARSRATLQFLSASAARLPSVDLGPPPPTHPYGADFEVKEEEEDLPLFLPPSPPSARRRRALPGHVLTPQHGMEERASPTPSILSQQSHGSTQHAFLPPPRSIRSPSVSAAVPEPLPALELSPPPPPDPEFGSPEPQNRGSVGSGWGRGTPEPGWEPQPPSGRGSGMGRGSGSNAPPPMPLVGGGRGSGVETPPPTSIRRRLRHTLSTIQEAIRPSASAPPPPPAPPVRPPPPSSPSASHTPRPRAAPPTPGPQVPPTQSRPRWAPNPPRPTKPVKTLAMEPPFVPRRGHERMYGAARNLRTLDVQTHVRVETLLSDRENRAIRFETGHYRCDFCFQRNNPVCGRENTFGCFHCNDYGAKCTFSVRGGKARTPEGRLLQERQAGDPRLQPDELATSFPQAKRLIGKKEYKAVFPRIRFDERNDGELTDEESRTVPPQVGSSRVRRLAQDPGDGGGPIPEPWIRIIRPGEDMCFFNTRTYEETNGDPRLRFTIRRPPLPRARMSPAFPTPPPDWQPNLSALEPRRMSPAVWEAHVHGPPIDMPPISVLEEEEEQDEEVEVEQDEEVVEQDELESEEEEQEEEQQQPPQQPAQFVPSESWSRRRAEAAKGKAARR
ncbi:hypothetical protein CALVIDRAFT_568908 [Calocera viscosa TUFC12733]|uniref:Zn(2)-C6 fungal-type domain-containing protein n=1 Tax=Calocera viscosa (strain TUFC12733) TaxID=1330018 RepID=A0A167GKR6_CALVF|nr:hypothetical protein CALVIDRAFT_568908 [Calocera viscosa TUFC12733]